jgi:c-di-GMP-related signal transduction protein
MGNKRLKLARGLGNITPMSVNFSDLEMEFEEQNAEFEPSDNGLEQKRMEDTIEYEELVVQILCSLEPREKLIFVYQLLRDGGYKIDHASFAKTVCLSRTQFMRILETVRTKSMLYVMGYQGRLGQKRHKGE